MKCNSCITPKGNGKCPQDCLEKLFVTSLDSEGCSERKKDNLWREDVCEFSMEVWFLTENEDLFEVQEVIERVCKDHSDKWFSFLQAPLIYDVTRRYGELVRQQQDLEAAYDSNP